MIRLREIAGALLMEQVDDHKLVINFSSTFPSGMYDEKYLNRSEFEKKMGAIYEFIQTFPENQIEINVIGGESQVTNPKGFEEKGSLAKKRSSIIMKKIKEYLQRNHVDNENIQFKIAQPVIGSTPYKQGDDVHQASYTQEQFIKVEIKVVAENAPPSWCSSSDSGKGKVGRPETGFIADYKRYELKGDVGSIILKFDPVIVPDMFIVRYDGQVYNTGFIGNGDLSYRVKIATILATYYQDKELPAHFNGIRIQNISTSAFQEFEKAMMNHNAYENFIDDVAPIMKIDIGRYRNWKQFRNSEEFKKLVWSDMTPHINQANNEVQLVDGYRQLTIPKRRGQNELELWVVGLLGTTVWTLKFACEPSALQNLQESSKKKEKYEELIRKVLLTKTYSYVAEDIKAEVRVSDVELANNGHGCLISANMIGRRLNTGVNATPLTGIYLDFAKMYFNKKIKQDIELLGINHFNININYVSSTINEQKQDKLNKLQKLISKVLVNKEFKIDALTLLATAVVDEVELTSSDIAVVNLTVKGNFESKDGLWEDIYYLDDEDIYGAHEIITMMLTEKLNMYKTIFNLKDIDIIYGIDINQTWDDEPFISEQVENRDKQLSKLAKKLMVGKEFHLNAHDWYDLKSKIQDVSVYEREGVMNVIATLSGKTLMSVDDDGDDSDAEWVDVKTYNLTLLDVKLELIRKLSSYKTMFNIKNTGIIFDFI